MTISDLKDFVESYVAAAKQAGSWSVTELMMARFLRMKTIALPMSKWLK